MWLERELACRVLRIMKLRGGKFSCCLTTLIHIVTLQMTNVTLITATRAVATRDWLEEAGWVVGSWNSNGCYLSISRKRLLPKVIQFCLLPKRRKRERGKRHKNRLLLAHINVNLCRHDISHCCCWLLAKWKKENLSGSCYIAYIIDSTTIDTVDFFSFNFFFQCITSSRLGSFIIISECLQLVDRLIVWL